MQGGGIAHFNIGEHRSTSFFNLSEVFVDVFISINYISYWDYSKYYFDDGGGAFGQPIWSQINQERSDYFPGLETVVTRGGKGIEPDCGFGKYRVFYDYTVKTVQVLGIGDINMKVYEEDLSDTGFLFLNENSWAYSVHL